MSAVYSCEGHALLGCSGVVCLCVCVKERERRKRRTVRVKKKGPVLKGLYSSNTNLHMLAQTAHKNTDSLSVFLTHTHVIALFTGLNFGSSHSQAAFISVCLDTIYYQLFTLVLSPSLRVCLAAAGYSDGLRVCVCECGEALVGESVCHPFFMWVSFSCFVPKEEVRLSALSVTSIHPCGSQSGCDGL